MDDENASTPRMEKKRGRSFKKVDDESNAGLMKEIEHAIKVDVRASLQR
jgi:hypothetical protein